MVPLGRPGVAVDELLKCVQGTRQKAVPLSDEADKKHLLFASMRLNRDRDPGCVPKMENTCLHSCDLFLNSKCISKEFSRSLLSLLHPYLLPEGEYVIRKTSWKAY